MLRNTSANRPGEHLEIRAGRRNQHESFHVLQTRQAIKRLEVAEKAHRQGERYWAADDEMGADWETEIELLRRALVATDDATAATWQANSWRSAICAASVLACHRT